MRINSALGTLDLPRQPAMSLPGGEEEKEMSRSLLNYVGPTLPE